MAVYVDDMCAPLGRMLMCHMVADTRAELLAMADTIGIEHRHLQYRGSYREHFDICKAKRALAVQAGAVELSTRDLVVLISRRRP
jgi:Protein of unknown function (DUF4031)